MWFSVHTLASDRPIPHSKIPTQYSYFATYEKILQLNTTKQINVFLVIAQLDAQILFNVFIYL